MSGARRRRSAGLVDIQSENLVETCAQRGLTGSDCVRNFNAQFAVAILAFLIMCAQRSSGANWLAPPD